MPVALLCAPRELDRSRSFASGAATHHGATTMMFGDINTGTQVLVMVAFLN